MTNAALESRVAHDKDLLVSFGGSMDGWEYTGVVLDAGKAVAKCGCGHAIRYEFVWGHKDGRSNITGSVCVNNAAFIDPTAVAAMEADLEALKAKQAADRKAARLAAETEAVKAKVAELEAAIASSPYGVLVRANEEVRGWVGESVYGARLAVRGAHRAIRGALTLKTPKGQLKRLEEVRKSLRYQFSYINLGY